MCRSILLCVVAALLLAACEDAGDPVIPVDNTPVPVITSISPDSGKAGDTIVVSGNNFGIEESGSTVRFNETNGFILSWSNSEVQTIVPSNLPIGILQLEIIRNNAKSNNLNFKLISGEISDTTPSPIISFTIPDSGKKGDTIVVRGTNFGDFDSNCTIRFGSINGAILTWNDTTIQTIVPQSTSSGITQIVVIRGIKISNPISFNILPTITQVSFQNDIRPLINAYGCSGCHPGNGNFSVATHATIITRVSVGNGDGSLLVQKLRGQAGTRMPVGGPFMTSVEIQKFVDWINQGALNN
jgi:hypothetical protein